MDARIFLKKRSKSAIALGSAVAIALSLAIVLVSSRPAAALAPRVWTALENINTSQEKCLEKSAETMKDNSDIRNVVLTPSGAIGNYGDSTGVIQCVTSRRLVFFVVSGTDIGEMRSLLFALRRAF